MVGLIYTLLEGGLVSTFIPDNDAQLDRFVLAEGEAMLRISDDQYAEIQAAIAAAQTMQATDQVLAAQMMAEARERPQELINQHTGKPSPPARQAIVDTDGWVVDVIQAYPSTFPLADGFTMIAHPYAVAGDRFIDGQWISIPIPDVVP